MVQMEVAFATSQRRAEGGLEALLWQPRSLETREEKASDNWCLEQAAAAVALAFDSAIGDGKKQGPTQTSLSSPLWRQDHLISPKPLAMTREKILPLY